MRQWTERGRLFSFRLAVGSEQFLPAPSAAAGFFVPVLTPALVKLHSRHKRLHQPAERQDSGKEFQHRIWIHHMRLRLCVRSLSVYF